MQLHTYRKYSRNSGQILQETDELGSAYVEFLLCLPFLITLIVGIIDIGRGLALYMTISRISFEGARYFATLPGARQQTCTMGPSQLACDRATDIDLIHLKVRDHLKPLFDHTIATYRTSTIITSLYGPEYQRPIPGGLLGVAGGPTGQDRTLTVTVTAHFDPLFPTFGLLNSLSASSSGPYLLTRLAS